MVVVVVLVVATVVVVVPMAVVVVAAVVIAVAVMVVVLVVGREIKHNTIRTHFNRGGQCAPHLHRCHERLITAAEQRQLVDCRTVQRPLDVLQQSTRQFVQHRVGLRSCDP